MTSKQIGLLAGFVAAKIEFAVVGGVAVNAHGYMRTTSDLDLFIRPTEENARLVHAALLALGVPLDGIEAADLLNDEANLRFGPSEDHIDLLPSIGDIPSEQVWSNRVDVAVHGFPFRSSPGPI